MTFPRSYASQVTVPLPDDAEVRPVLERLFGGYDPAATLNVVKMFSGTQSMFPGFLGLVQAIFGELDVAPKHRAMIVLRVAKRLDAPYEWQVNSVMGHNAGLSDSDIAAAGSDGPVSGVDPAYVLLCQAVDELTSSKTLTDETLTGLREELGDVVTRKYILTMAFFTMVGLCLNANRVPLETTDKVGTKTAPLG
jgi:hypothetical protein